MPAAVSEDCDHPEGSLSHHIGELGPMTESRENPGTARARVLSYVWICGACGTEFSKKPRQKERSV